MRSLTEIDRIIRLFPPDWRRICASRRPELVAAARARWGALAGQCGCGGCLDVPSVYRECGVPWAERITPDEYDAWVAAGMDRE